MNFPMRFTMKTFTENILKKYLTCFRNFHRMESFKDFEVNSIACDAPKRGCGRWKQL